MSSRDLLLAASGVTTGGGGGGGGSTNDPNFNQVSLLLHGDGTNGAQNNTFLDSSTNNFTITRNGNTTQGTNTPFSQAAGYWSNYSDNSNYVSVPANAALSQGTGNFTYECWVYLSAYGGSQNVFEQPTATFYVNASGYITLYTSTQGNQSGNIVVPLNSWSHLAWVRSSGTLQMYVNGVSSFSASNTKDIQSTGAMPIGHFVNGASYMSNARITNTAVYTSAFTPPTTPLTAITNTSLLTCQSNNFKDNSSNNFTLTATGTPSVQPFSPFAPTSAYSTSVNGGSMYFDGTGDYLTTPSITIGTGTFTIEGWIKPLSYSTLVPFVCFGNDALTTGALFFITTSGYAIWYQNGNGTVAGTQKISLNTWVHLAAVRTGTTTTVYVNGINDGTWTTDSSSYSGVAYIAKENFNGAGPTGNCDISNVRILVGTALYTANFTPPTAPLTAITNTSLLLSGTNAGIYDNAIKNNLETVGNAQVSTSVVKYGTGSMKFNGTTDYLITPASPNLDLNAGNFTIEGWFYFNSVASGQQPVSGYTTASNENYAWYMTSTGGLAYYLSSTGTGWNIASNVTMGTVSANTWTHIALVRNGSTFTPYINGVAGTTSSSSSAIYSSGTGITLGAYAGAYFFNGYIDDFRVTKGIARYTTTFTPPTQAFPNS